jgi:hypothetical protein
LHKPCALPNLPKALRAAEFDLDNASFLLSRRALQASAHAGLPLWQDYIVIPLARSASDITDQFCIPEDRAVEVARGSRSDRVLGRGEGGCRSEQETLSQGCPSWLCETDQR